MVQNALSRQDASDIMQINLLRSWPDLDLTWGQILKLVFQSQEVGTCFEPARRDGSARREGSKHVLFDFEGSISKVDLRSGQVKVKSRSDHDPSKSIFISSEASWWDKSYDTIRASLFPFFRELLEKKRFGRWGKLWARGTSSKFRKNKFCFLRLPS